MSPIFQDKKSVDLMYFQKSDGAILWIIFAQKQAKSNFSLKNCDLYLVYMLLFCRLHWCFITEDWISKFFLLWTPLSIFNLWKKVKFMGSRINIRKSANGGILLWKLGNYLATSFRALFFVFVRLSVFVVGTCWTNVRSGCYQEEN